MIYYFRLNIQLCNTRRLSLQIKYKNKKDRHSKHYNLLSLIWISAVLFSLTYFKYKVFLYILSLIKMEHIILEIHPFLLPYEVI
jgi:hypothetical protein